MASRRNRIKVFHPDYDPPELLFILPADDGPEHDQTPFFIINDAAHAFANNPQEGWLSRSQYGSDRIEREAWLGAGNYFYHVSTSDKPWPVVANFESWSFPHAQGAPSHWREANESNSLGYGSPSRSIETCRITQHELALECAHIIPRAEKPWFGTNRMDQYGNVGGRTGDSVAESIANRIWLTSDAHKIWDESRFTIVPHVKEQVEGIEVVGWRTHRLNEHQEVLKRWHNQPLFSVEGRAGEYFYARFVWDIFPLIQGFHHSGPPRRLVIYNQNQCRHEVQMLTKAERRIFTLNQGRTRSASPTKRQRSAQPSDEGRAPLDNEWDADSTYSDKGPAHKRRRTSLHDQSQDSAIAGMQSSREDLKGSMDEDSVNEDSVFRRHCLSSSHDRLTTQRSASPERGRGRSRTRR